MCMASDARGRGLPRGRQGRARHGVGTPLLVQGGDVVRDDAPTLLLALR